METYQYITMKQYLYKGQEQVLESRLHNVEPAALQKIQTSKDVVKNSTYLIGKMITGNISVAVIDNSGNRVTGISKGSELERHDKLQEDKNNDKSSILENNIKFPKNIYDLPIPELSKNDYIKLLQQDGDLEGYKVIKDENKNLQVVIWRKIGNLRHPSGLIQLSISAMPIQGILRHQLYIYIVASILVLIIGSILGKIIFKYTLKPLHNVTNTVEKINIEQLNTRLPLETGQLEIDKLSNAFNNMLERIEVSFEKEQYIKEKMRRFISDASHELRTPLTSIHGFVEVLLLGAAKSEKQLNLALNSILIESERLTKLVNDLLLLTRLEQKVQMEIGTEDIGDIIKEVSPQLQILCGERKVELQLKNNVLVKVNRNQIKQVIFNLVQNAVNHTDKNTGTINISIDSSNKFSDNFVVLKIKDNGTGIPKEHIDEIFERFFRSEVHRSRKHGGYGLGLSIVKSIIDAHDGKIEVDSELGVGTSFFIYLKVVK